MKIQNTCHIMDEVQLQDTRKLRRKEMMKLWRSKNKDKIRGYVTKYYSKNKEQIDAANKVIKQRNKETYNKVKKYHSAKRRSRIKQAVPMWADLEKIREIYLNCPEGHQVDHIVPLKNKLVCGLHVEHNLQYLTIQDNLIKGNNFDGTGKHWVGEYANGAYGGRSSITGY